MARAHRWNPDGTITQRRDPDHRMIFVESDGFDDLFSNIERLIGMPIERIVMESKARATRDFISRLIRGPKGALVRFVGIKRITRAIEDMSSVMGYGHAEVLEFDWKNRYIRIRITDPYSLPLFCGDAKGSTEAIRKRRGSLTCEKTGPDTFLIEGRAAPQESELDERLIPTTKRPKPGDIRYMYCSECGAPAELVDFSWDLDKGIIRHRESDLRFAMVGPVGLQVIFEELEKELGESIPDAVIEAQKIHARAMIESLVGRFGMKNVQVSNIRKLLAVFGLGNLVSVDTSEDGFSARVENVALPLLVVGTSLALREYITGKPATAVWTVTEDGALELSVRS